MGKQIFATEFFKSNKKIKKFDLKIKKIILRVK